MANADRVTGGKFKLSSESESCATCAKRNRICSTKYCVDCSERFCTVCNETGDTITGHTLHNVIECQNDPDTVECDVRFTCDDHPNADIITFCKLHDVLCCSECVKEHHGSCPTLTLPNAYKDLADTETEKKMMENLALIKEHLIDTIKLHKDVKKVLQNDKDKIMNSLRELRSSMEKMLEDLERSAISKLLKACENIESEFRQNAEAAEKHLSDILKYEKEINQQMLNDANKFVLFKRVDHQKELSRTASEKCLKPPVRSIHFEPNIKLKTLLQEAEQLGTFSFLSNEKSGVKKQPDFLISSGQISQDVKTEEDENLSIINRICVTPDGNVCLVDYANKKLKLLESPSYKVIDSMNLERDVTEIGLCPVDNGEVMICVGQEIIFVSVVGKLKLVRSLNLTHECLNVGYSDRKIFVSDGAGCIRLYSMSGTPISEIHTDVYENSLVCSGDGNFVYLGAEEELVAIDMHGGIYWKYSSEEIGMSCIRDVNIDGFGNVLVCGDSPGEGNDIVACVDADGKVISTYDGGFEHYYRPSCLCFDRQHFKIIVANCSGGNIVINDFGYNL
ncbi:uncharacterized protein LOC132729730 [Ruditapes philippinarum]|uniref:uncharacterized protein LOC132729730 n=1 Tax=Ruditapes philippinarum TaxID=129788 RepID=UPI00295B9B49|nr:uncharacterized protein LOC132729730 [Ruditapes philippinarum]